MTDEDGTQTLYSTDITSFPNLDPGDEQYDKLKARKGEIGSQFRLTLTYYFK